MISTLKRHLEIVWRIAHPSYARRSGRPGTIRKRGCVHLVGAGCGDPELLTLKALRLIKTADVLVCDRLVAPEVVALASSGTKTIYVGKQPGRHAKNQAEIESLLVEHANLGRTVVRLKGGDPFMFGRGGEEMQACRAAGIPVTICPGVTAALGCAAAAGIPLTQRGMAQSCVFITGHDQFDELPFNSLGGDLRGVTLVIYMGVGKLEGIVSGLIARGLPADWPVAVVENGTTIAMRQVLSTLENLVSAVKKAGIGSPALLFVGKTAELAVLHAHSETQARPEW